LQHAFTDQHGRRIHLTNLIRATLQDWLTLATTEHSTPVPLHTVVPHPPHIIGATDASKIGMGGFYVTMTAAGPQHYLWRAPFPNIVSNNLLSTNNPNGAYTNSDFELAALVLGSAVIAHHQPNAHQHICLASNNTPAVSWISKGSVTSTGPPAFLLHLLANNRHSNKFQLTVTFTLGDTNTIADCCSRLFTCRMPIFYNT
jgi:hypothetical protein